jgi:hypothetical protein
VSVDPFVLVGSGRSGSGWMSHLLRACGVRCGHEQVFTLPAGLDPTSPVDWSGWDADASWMAVPRLPLPYPTVAVVRHPLPVVDSMVRIGLFDQSRADPYAQVYYRWRTAVGGELSPQDRALSAWWHTTAAAVEHADLIVPVEQVGAGVLADLLVRYAGRGEAVAVRQAGLVLAMDTDTARNRKGSEKLIGYSGGWHRHRPGLAGRARALAIRLGYDPDLP